MRFIALHTPLVLALLFSTGANIGIAGAPWGPAPFDLKKAQAEVETRYAKAHPEIIQCSDQ